jgi:hypothetical protein
MKSCRRRQGRDHAMKTMIFIKHERCRSAIDAITGIDYQ